MKSLLLSLYDGEICPKEHIEAMLKECRERERITRLLEERFEKKLDQSLTQEFNKLLLKYHELNELQRAEAFANGFSIGARLIIEAFSR